MAIYICKGLKKYKNLGECSGCKIEVPDNILELEPDVAPPDVCVWSRFDEMVKVRWRLEEESVEKDEIYTCPMCQSKLYLKCPECDKEGNK